MSLVVEIKVNIDEKKNIQDYVASDEKLLVVFKKGKHGANIFYLNGVNDFLSDDYDIGGKYLLIEDQIKKPLQSFIKKLKNNSDLSFEINFVWAGESINNHIEISLDDLLSLIEQNRILNSSCYIVAS